MHTFSWGSGVPNLRLLSPLTRVVGHQRGGVVERPVGPGSDDHGVGDVRSGLDLLPPHLQLALDDLEGLGGEGVPVI